ncbi:MAG: glycosyltransferase family 2 protein [bacterium]|nr:glycosyltransferase family 2 protein [bacterium]
MSEGFGILQGDRRDDRIVCDEPLFSIIVLSWNSLRYLPRCLESIREQTCRSFELICVDNGSVDGSVEWLTGRDVGEYVGVATQVILHDRNKGFAAGMNSGIRVARGRWVVPLNVDMVLAADFLEEARKAAERHRDVAMIGAKVYAYEDGLTERVVTAGIWPTRHLTARTRLERAEREEEVFGPAGCCPILLHSALRVAGLPGEVTGAREAMVYDEDYFAYGEDVDLYFRLQLLGFRCMYVPRVRGWHVHSGTQEGVRWYEKDAGTLGRVPANAFFTLMKNCPEELLVRLAGYVIGAPLAQAVLLLGKRPSRAVYPLGAYGGMVRGLGRAVRIRRWLQARRQREGSELWRWFM